MAVHPSLFLIAGAVAVPFLPGRLRQAVLIAAPALALFAAFALRDGATWAYPFLIHELAPLRVDALALVFGVVFSLLTLLGSFFALHVKRPGEHVAALLYAAGSVAVVFAGDWLTLFAAWEVMTAASVFLIWFRGTARSLRAGFRYIMVHFVGGNLLLAGILLHISGGNYAVSLLTPADGAAFWLILSGVAVNAAIPPLHAWLTDSYPEATVTGSVFLSGLTTKVAVYVLIRVFAGAEVLIWLGVAMALYGVVYAVLENDIRRLLSYHIISQVGYMVAGAGLGTALALNGAAAHAFSHVLYKSLLFMGVGAVIQATGRNKLTELGGIGRRMPAAVLLYTIGAVSISGFPLFNGFISKSIIVSAASVGGFQVVELLLNLASVGTFLHTGLKLPYFMFFGPDRGLRPARVPVNMYLGMAGAAFWCFILGILPGLLYVNLPYAMDFHPYTTEHVVQVVQLLLATAVGFVLLLPKLGGQPTISLDFDWFYRRPLARLLEYTVESLRLTENALEAKASNRLQRIRPYLDNPFLAPSRLARGGAWWRQRSTGDQPDRYDEHRYRPPVGLTITFTLLLLAAAVALVVLRG